VSIFPETYLAKSIKELMDVGDKRQILFTKLGIRNFKDLLFHLPHTYVDRTLSPAIFNIENESVVTLELSVQEVNLKSNFRSRTPSKILCNNKTGVITLIYFNNIPPYIKQNFVVGSSIIVSGKVTIQDGDFVMVHPDIVVKSTEKYKVPPIEPVYFKVEGLTSKLIWHLVQKVLARMTVVEEWLPKEVLSATGWNGIVESLKTLHKPTSINLKEIHTAKKRLAFDEVFAHQICLHLLRNKMQSGSKTPAKFSGKLSAKFLDSLSFKMTDEQKIAIDTIRLDQLSDKRMLRLLMGDVGCGKTLVAVCAALNAVEGGKQASIMVPTEVLAQQHYKNIIKYTEKLGVRTRLLWSNLKAPEKKQVLKDLKNGDVDILIGTHALFQQKVQFLDLSLVIIDEQHKFGVKQRMALLGKGKNVDLLMLSATPIPRTIRMLGYGDMDVSIIKNKPISNMPITTTVLPSSKIYKLLDRIKVTTDHGEKVYWVCPLIDASEKLQLSYIKNTFTHIQKVLGDKVAMLHGKMKSEEREKVMEEFKVGKLTTIIATTVIEVGIDVPEATIMVIENAERFGLSQLHQLRGRVGRGSAKSYCVLLHGQKIGMDSKKRLNILKNYSDGFKIAEKDLELRGGGDYLGFKQSGESGFKFFDSLQNADIINLADKHASLIVKEKLSSGSLMLLNFFDKQVYFNEEYEANLT
jgi:ATP-dependent DNA helicase RecG